MVTRVPPAWSSCAPSVARAALVLAAHLAPTLAACAPSPGAVAGAADDAAASSGSSRSRPPGQAAGSGNAPAATAGASAAPSADASARGRAAAPQVLPLDEARRVVFPADDERAAALAACPAPDAQIDCLVGRRLAADPAAARTALDLFARTGDVVGVEREQTMDGGFRGRIRLVPEAPVGPHRKHLEWIGAAAGDFDRFFAALAERAPGAPPKYRWRGLGLKFFRSVGRTTPSAYAQGWTVAYNVSGSLHSSADAVRETMFHEIFHLNDAAHTDWSSSALSPVYDAVVARCSPPGASKKTAHPSTPCVAPYAPNETKLKVGGYYAFHPDNGVREYAAELAIRYYREQRAVLGMAAGDAPRVRGPHAEGAFKCGPPENARAWELLVREFFGGVDLVAPCASAP